MDLPIRWIVICIILFGKTSYCFSQKDTCLMNVNKKSKVCMFYDESERYTDLIKYVGNKMVLKHTYADSITYKEAMTVFDDSFKIIPGKALRNVIYYTYNKKDSLVKIYNESWARGIYSTYFRYSMITGKLKTIKVIDEREKVIESLIKYSYKKRPDIRIGKYWRIEGRREKLTQEEIVYSDNSKTVKRYKYEENSIKYTQVVEDKYNGKGILIEENIYNRK